MVLWPRLGWRVVGYADVMKSSRVRISEVKVSIGEKRFEKTLNIP